MIIIDKSFLVNKEYLELNFIVTKNYVYVAYYDNNNILVAKQYKIIEGVCPLNITTYLSLGTVNRKGLLMALTCDELTIIRKVENIKSTDIVISDADYKDLSKLVFQSKKINDTNKFYTSVRNI